MKRLLLLIAIVLCTASMHAQEIELTFWQKVNNAFVKPALVDTTRIYQPKAGFSISTFSTIQKAGFDVDVDFAIDFDDVHQIGLSQYSLTENPCKKIGLEVGYGKIVLGYGLEVGPPSAWKKSSLGLGIIGKSWGAKFNYFKITNPFKSSLILGEAGGDDFIQDEFITEEAAVLKSFTIDGYYAFNNKRFAYPATYKVGMVQRRTAGSWMLTARYMQGSLYNSPEASWDSYNLLDCFTTLQASVGGGYSVNFVLWHKDPSGPRDKGLRNLTINLTAMPMITMVNYLKTTSYKFNYDEETGVMNNVSEKVSKIWCYPMPNYIGSAAIGLTLWRFFFTTQFTYNTFYFRSSHAFKNNQLDIPDYVDGLTFKGSFHDWMVKGQLVYRF